MRAACISVEMSSLYILIAKYFFIDFSVKNIIIILAYSYEESVNYCCY